MAMQEFIQLYQQHCQAVFVAGVRVQTNTTVDGADEADLTSAVFDESPIRTGWDAIEALHATTEPMVVEITIPSHLTWTELLTLAAAVRLPESLQSQLVESEDGPPRCIIARCIPDGWTSPPVISHTADDQSPRPRPSLRCGARTGFPGVTHMAYVHDHFRLTDILTPRMCQLPEDPDEKQPRRDGATTRAEAVSPTPAALWTQPTPTLAKTPAVMNLADLNVVDVGSRTQQ